MSTPELHFDSSLILILNVGAWWKAGVPAYKAHISAIASTVRRLKKRGVSVIWRSTLPGHSGCAQQHQPITTTTSPIAARHLQQNGPTEHNWGLFTQFNAIASNALGRAGAGAVVMDAHAIMQGRPDAHIDVACPGRDVQQGADCLHWSMPGPLDELNRVLYALLAAREV
eukprot:g501.t1